MNKQEEELIQFIVDQTQTDRDKVIRILNYRGATDLIDMQYLSVTIYRIYQLLRH